MSIVARSVPNNGRVKEAKVSFYTRSTGKAINGKMKRGVNKRANDNEIDSVRQAKYGNVRQAIIGKIRRGNNGNKNIGRGEDKSKNVRGNGEGERVDWGVQPQQHLYSYSLFHSYLHLYSQ